jgi:tRNA threonylcarbamoyladenosine biosynthesis protein TsaE
MCYNLDKDYHAMASDIPAAWQATTHDPAETERLGAQLGAHLAPGDLICLVGDLGAGKTCLVQGLARGWGALERVTSPTFTMINEYRRAIDDTRFHHVDCYRLTEPAEVWSLGLDDVLDTPGVVVIEWAERIRDLLPDEALWIEIQDIGASQRRLTMTACGPRATALLPGLTD